MKKLLLVSLLAGLVLPVPVVAQSTSTITGRLLGNDANPMPMAHVRLSGGTGFTEYLHELGDPEFACVQVDPDGTFKISTDSLGPLTLTFTGVGHERLRLPLILTEPVDLSIEAQLSFLPLRDDFSEATLTYDFDDVARGKTMAFDKKAPGRYEIDLPTSKKEFKYRIRGIAYHADAVSVANATADSYEHDFEGIYTSILYPADGHVRVTLDDTRPRHPRLPPAFAFSDPQGFQSKYAVYYMRFQEELKRFYLARQDFMADGGKDADFTHDWTSFQDRIKKELLTVRDTVLRDELAIEYLETAIRSKANRDDAYGREILSDVSPQSHAWVYHGTVALQAGKHHPLEDAYVQRMVETHPTSSFRAYLVFWLCTYAKHEKRRPEYLKLYSALTQQYRQTPPGRLALHDLRESGRVSVGKKLPAFSFTSLDDSNHTYTNAEFLGKYVLIDLWATWCGPCVAEMPLLHDAYAKYHSDAFEMLSVSFDPSPGNPRYFRSMKWKMPWHNGYVESDRQPEVSVELEVSLPKPMLIGPTGTLLETGDALRGRNLETTLSKYLNQK